ncbi:helix-turn-helix domain-containing protein [Microcystis aeruginosa]|uniref:helix-turn-helix domain-containing protein n=1 Tax=Microcystis aeruginosa TaxID=1126 RepID=UPI001F4FDDB6|nr:helix-turn-helix transcriptional regulator [Microcystis aeruginosa]
MSFVECLIAARKDANLTQAALAKAIKKPQSFVAKYENGERRLDVVEFLLVSRCNRCRSLRNFKSKLSKLVSPHLVGKGYEYRRCY